MATLICGSVAFDTIMVFPDHFKNHILPEKVHMLSVSFLVPEMRREYGGCAGNIAYSLKLLGGNPIVMATVGHDFGDYRARLESKGVRMDCVRELADHYTPQCFITTDISDNQITAFHPGAMDKSGENSFAHVQSELTLGHVGPDSLTAMVQRSRDLKAAGIPFVFDPGQGTPLLSGADLIECIDAADYVTFNDYEAELVRVKTGQTIEDIAGRCKALIVTLGSQGSLIYTNGEKIEIAPVVPKQVVDPTGCGDAYRAGLLYGIEQGWDWKTTGQLASLIGSIKVANRGAQNHHFDQVSIARDYEAAFGEKLVF
ncbi:carbohydrate kinase family protein [Burkholderiaceae bacterium DAT-1]|nr:carbohydrate kinase family protein [Burkholderiaceae bacterium DAT-1]